MVMVGVVGGRAGEGKGRCRRPSRGKVGTRSNL